MTDLEVGTYVAIVDSIEEGLATVFFEQGGEAAGSTILTIDELPAKGQHENAVFTVTVSETNVSWSYEEAPSTRRMTPRTDSASPQDLMSKNEE